MPWAATRRPACSVDSPRTCWKYVGTSSSPPKKAAANMNIVMIEIVSVAVLEQPQVEQRVLGAERVPDEGDHEHEADEHRHPDPRGARTCPRPGSTRRRRGTAPGPATSAPCRGSRRTPTAPGCPWGAPRRRRRGRPCRSATLIRKIQCQLATSISQPPMIGPRIGPSSIGTPRIAISRPIRCGPAARVMIVMPTGMSMPPPRPCRTRKTIRPSMLQAVAHSAEPATNSAMADMYSRLVPNRSAAQPRQRDHGGQGQRVAGHRPGDGGVRERVAGRAEHRLEGRQRDVDDRDVQDRHDGAEHDDARDLEDRGVDVVGQVGQVGLGLRGHVDAPSRARARLRSTLRSSGPPGPSSRASASSGAQAWWPHARRPHSREQKCPFALAGSSSPHHWQRPRWRLRTHHRTTCLRTESRSVRGMPESLPFVRLTRKSAPAVGAVIPFG